MVRLHRAFSHQRGRVVGQRIGQEVFELARLVAAEGEAGEIVALEGPSATSRLRARCSGVGSVAKGYRGSVASRMMRLRLPRLGPTAERRSDPAPHAATGDTHAQEHDE